MASSNTHTLNAAKKILVVGPSWVGDMVMAQSLFISLKNIHPDCQIDVLAPSWTLSLLQRMPEVNEAIIMPVPRGRFALMERIKLGKSLRSKGYDQAILLPNSWKSAIPTFFANIPLRTGYIGECRWGLLNDARKLNKNLLTMTVQRFVALGLPVDAPMPPSCPKPALTISEDRQQAVIDKFQLTPVASRILALCPGAEYGPAKRWPPEHYAEVARQRIDQGWQVWLFGSEKDKNDAAQINRAVSGLCRDFTGSTSLAEAVDLMSLADAVVSNDSGLMHVAAALDKKVIAVYGSSDPGFTPPLNGKARIITLKLDCSPCFKRECPLGHSNCLTGITPEQVLNIINN
ncbi:lipopolysaccharide heptosyltransferase II [Candidatus Methylobacter oryzae]|uniref:lipopolysaccharide heptosyltransferase II n=1 Tax=Candidatus Methylobacter oryzae TaxID=2497749 RepID=A0ABY3C5E2_9GAMM|nr:lipopolysaccharide heptosyltransferase II [Candidatus Methylobacter oryzae]TRW90239.1 lipopolysaccharide heptosyltransferase II [Candidatus Methylobacter oryzae]